MNFKKIATFIDNEIFKKYKSRRDFAIKTKRNKNSFNKSIDGMLTKGSQMTLINLESVLNDLGYELKLDIIELKK